MYILWLRNTIQIFQYFYHYELIGAKVDGLRITLSGFCFKWAYAFHVVVYGFTFVYGLCPIEQGIEVPPLVLLNHLEVRLAAMVGADGDSVGFIKVAIDIN